MSLDTPFRKTRKKSYSMSQERFWDIKAGLSSSMQMMLDHIKRYLDAGKASAFVTRICPLSYIIP